MFKNLYFLHKSLIYPKYTYEEIKKEQNKTIFHVDKFNLEKCIKSIYFNTFYFFSNFYYLIDIKKRMDDKNYINQIIEKQNLDMYELRTKTNKIFEINTNLYSGVLKWIAGNCWLNALVTNGYESKLEDYQIEIINSISNSIELVESIERPLVLFHGFEKYSNYMEESFDVGSIFQFTGILSKTSKFDIALGFAQKYNFFQPKFFIVHYPSGSKHIGLDIKPCQFDEYEYISKPNEKFKIIRIC